MMNTGATLRQRLTAFVLMMTLLLTTWTPAAQASMMTVNELLITVNYTDTDGMPMSIPASPVLLTESPEPTFWVTLEPTLLGSMLDVQVFHPDPDYSFRFLDTGSMNLLWTPELDASGVDPLYANYITCAYRGEDQEQLIVLYISSQEMPMDELPGVNVDIPVIDGTVQIPVYYVLEDGTPLDMQYLSASRGQTLDVSPSSSLTAGYTLLNAGVQSVYVDIFGNTSPAEVTFIYGKAKQPDVEFIQPEVEPVPDAQVTVLYQLDDGTLLDQQIKPLAPGTHTIWPESNAVSGLDLAGDYSFDVYVDQKGVPSVDVVTFIFRKVVDDPFVEVIPPAPQQALVTVLYQLEDGTFLDQQVKTLDPGEHTIWPESAAVSGLDIVGDSSAYVYADANGIATPSIVTFTFRKAYVAPVESSITVYYKDNKGNVLDIQDVRLTEGPNEIRPQSRIVDGMTLLSEASVVVTVYPDGSTDLASISFIYQAAAPVEAVLPIYYYHTDGYLIDTQEQTLTEGTHTIHPQSTLTAGLELVGDASQAVTVYSDGSTDLASVTFLYQSPAPTEAEIQVYYYHQDGTQLDATTKRCTEGPNTIYAESDKVGKLMLVSDPAVTVTVYPDGTTDLASITFVYKDPDPAEARIDVYYHHETRGILDTQEVRLVEGMNTIWPESDLVDGLELVSDSPLIVHVDSTGAKDVNSITFHYRDPAPAEATITVYYYHENGTQLDKQELLLTEGNHTITPNSKVVSELELVGEATKTVVVRADGSVDAATVSFIYRDADVMPVVVDLPVLYQLSDGTLLDEQTLKATEGENLVQANSEKAIGMTLIGESSTFVYVDKNGLATPSTVVFTYQKPSIPVTVHYLDTMGNVIATPQTIEYAPGTHVIAATPADLMDGYELAMDATQSVTVFEDGTTDPEVVEFYYRPARVQPVEPVLPVEPVKPVEPVEPVEPVQPVEPIEPVKPVQPTDTVVPVEPVKPSKVLVTVHYLDTMGETIATPQTGEYAPGTYQIPANPLDLPDGYELVMEAVQTVTVFADGTTDPEAVEFYYRPAPKYGYLTVLYADQQGTVIAGPFTEQLEPSRNHTIKADPTRVPAGYGASSAMPVEVYVSAEGKVDPAQVILIFAREVVETPIPMGALIHRYATVNANQVAFRTVPSAKDKNKTIIRRIDRNEKVYAVREEVGTDGKPWTEVIVGNRSGYMMSEYLDVMTQAESDQYALSIGATPVPTYTPTPSPTPKPTPTPYEQITPPLVEVIQPGTATPTSTPHTGYALTNRTTALRTGISASDVSIINNMEANQLVVVSGHMHDTYGQLWSVVTTLSQQSGYVLDADLRSIEPAEAQYYIDAWNNQLVEDVPDYLLPEVTIPLNRTGYAVTLGDNVPLRTMSGNYSSVSAWLSKGTVVYVTGQTITNDDVWNSVQYSDVSGGWGYIRDDMLRMMTEAETDAYLNGVFTTPEYVTTNQPWSDEGMSSYGYVDGSSVNFRKGPSKNDTRIRELKRYALCMVLGATRVDGVTWYKVTYGGEEGYVHGDYFHQMTISELSTFMNSEEYRQGLKNNSTTGDSVNDSIGVTNPGGLVPSEDQTISQWQGGNTGVHVSYAPFDPIATVGPITTATTIPTLEPILGWQSTATPEPATPTPTFNNVPIVSYAPTDNSGGGSALVWILVAVLLLISGAGVFAFVRYQQNKRRIALRAAQRRAYAAREAQRVQPQQGAQAAQPRTGMYPDQTRTRPAQPRMQQSYQPQQSTSSNFKRPQAGYTPYATPPQLLAEKPVPSVEDRPDTPATPAPSEPQRPNGRVGRRTAYRQAQQGSEGEDMGG